MTKHVVIVSGCMAVQARVKGNITENELFPDRIQYIAHHEHDAEIVFHVVTFKDLSLWPDKVKHKFDLYPIDLMIMQMRTHDYLNLINYGRTGAIHETFVGGEDGSSNTASSFYKRSKRFLVKKNSWWSLKVLKFMKSLNRHIIRNGLLLKNLFSPMGSAAGSRYRQVMIDGDRIASEKNVPIIYLGVTARPNSIIEDRVATKLNSDLSSLAKELGREYVDILSKRDRNGVYKFAGGSDLEKMISLSAVGHQEVAEKLLNAMRSEGLLDKD